MDRYSDGLHDGWVAGRQAFADELLADLKERGFGIALWQGHERVAIKKWIEHLVNGEKWEMT